MATPTGIAHAGQGVTEGSQTAKLRSHHFIQDLQGGPQAVRRVHSMDKWRPLASRFHVVGVEYGA